jgi:hypothetical protein
MAARKAVLWLTGMNPALMLCLKLQTILFVSQTKCDQKYIVQLMDKLL